MDDKGRLPHRWNSMPDEDEVNNSLLAVLTGLIGASAAPFLANRLAPVRGRA
jgi:hypothetical protein